MSLDSDIVKNFACRKTNSSYIANYGFAQHLKSILHDTLTNIDVLWRPNELIESNCVTNRYYHSELLGKVAALNIYGKFENCLSQLVKNKLL